MPLARHPEPFDHNDYVFELKYDGFRALAYVDGKCELVSRNGNTFKSFGSLATAVSDCISVPAVLDGEIVCLDEYGRSQFNHLLFRRKEPHFVVFDILCLDGRDVCVLPLIERKHILASIVPPQPCPLLYAQYVEKRGVDLFRLVCEGDLEGIVAKQKHALYDPDRPSWIKIKNRNYSQAVGRHELFGKRAAAR